MNKYLKALLLTLALLAFGLFATRYIDDSRLNSIASQLEEISLESQATQQLILYDSIFSDKEALCPALLKRVDLQVAKIQEVLSRLESAKGENFLSNYEFLKRRYLNQNVELYLLVEKAAHECEYSAVKPVVFFYPDKVFCANCQSQGKTLDLVRNECPGVRVFAFPYDLGLPVVELLEAKHGVSTVPAIVFRDSKVEGLMTKEQVKEFLGCE